MKILARLKTNPILCKSGDKLILAYTGPETGWVKQTLLEATIDTPIKVGECLAGYLEENDLTMLGLPGLEIALIGIFAQLKNKEGNLDETDTVS